ncbi:hypothetical protein ACIQUG_27320 [Ensifer sp. NPDC090286]|uniref:hypothetical protein n=1 Tax=Ensifer sp. NPDC090286 TaxID=3363991 RepID=UPI00383B5AAD
MKVFPPQASDLADVIYCQFLPYGKSGVELAPKAVASLLKNLLTIRALAREQEEEMRILELRVTTFDDRARNAGETTGDNIVRFPLRLVPSDGGAA